MSIYKILLFISADPRNVIPAPFMKIMHGLLLVGLLAVTFSVEAQRDKRFGLKMNLISTAAVKTFNLIPEYAINQRFSAQIGFYRTNNFTYKEHKFSGMAITPEVRVHLLPHYLKGLYAAPFFRYRKLTWEIPSKNAGADFISIGGGVSVGYQFLIKNLVMLDFFVGPAFSSHDIKVKTGVVDDFKLPITTSVGARAGIGVGFAF
jgi:hypothetical protein